MKNLRIYNIMERSDISRNRTTQALEEGARARGEGRGQAPKNFREGWQISSSPPLLASTTNNPTHIFFQFLYETVESNKIDQDEGSIEKICTFSFTVKVFV